MSLPSSPASAVSDEMEDSFTSNETIDVTGGSSPVRDTPSEEGLQSSVATKNRFSALSEDQDQDLDPDSEHSNSPDDELSPPPSEHSPSPSEHSPSPSPQIRRIRSKAGEGMTPAINKKDRKHK